MTTHHTFTGLAARPAIKAAGGMQCSAETLGTAEAITTNPHKTSPVDFNMTKLESPTGVPVRRMVRRNGSQCLVCGSRKSTTRIHTDNLGYDEVACFKHIAELERHADATLGVHNGVLRWHVTSSGGVMRGVPRVSPNAEVSQRAGSGASPEEKTL